MKRTFPLLVGWVAINLTARPADPPALPQAHAHNDYEHTRPLFDALDQGFCSVEADVWLVAGELRVAHDLPDASPARTLQRLYLDPLRARAEKGNGRVFRDAPLFTLLVDIKSDATNTYLALREVFRKYENILTRFEPDRTLTNAVTVIISGNRPRELMISERQRWAAYDGRLPDLDSNASPHFIPLISDNWATHSRWRGLANEGPLPEEDRTNLRQWVRRTHAQGRRLRLWGTPDNARAWKELAESGVDLINTDDLAGLKNFLQTR